MADDSSDRVGESLPSAESIENKHGRQISEEASSFNGPDPQQSDPGQLELSERQSLRRVPGLSTELDEVSEVEYRRLRLERVVLVGVWAHTDSDKAERSLAELKLLAQTAGSVVLDGYIQRRQNPDPATFIGRGKVLELRESVMATGADTIICDGELAPSQLRNLEDRTGVKVVDRTALILDIFAQHAKSKEGKAQVELAQLTYQTQRLRGWGSSLSRQAGGQAAGGAGIGGRGPGETKLETDRRRIQSRMTKLRRELRTMRTTRRAKRSQRLEKKIPAVVLAGYTNAGKSSLLNRLTAAGVLVEDALFATLDTTTRRQTTGEGRTYTISDTVGFVRHLPHQLIEAFRSTLEEVAEADVIVHVVDGSHPHPQDQISAVRQVLSDIGAGDILEIIAVNKADIIDATAITALLAQEAHAVVVSAHSGAGIDELLNTIESELPVPPHKIDVLVPYERGDLVNQLHVNAEIDSLTHQANGTHVIAHVSGDLAAKLAQYSQ